MDSLLFGGEEEPQVPERVLQNLLIKVLRNMHANAVMIHHGN